MNSLLYKKCRQCNIRCVGLHDIVVDPITRENKTYYYRDQLHLHLPTNEIGKFLQSTLISRFLNQEELPDESKNNNDSIDGVFNILASNMPGWLSIDRFQTDSCIQIIKFIGDNDTYFQLIELPFPILIKNISLYFESQVINASPSSSCQAIYESCDPTLQVEKNVFNGIPKATIIESDQDIKIEHDFSEYKFNNMHARYICISISKAQRIRLTKIGISRMRYSATN